MKTISINIPCFNEEENVVSIAEDIIALFDEKLSGYDYYIQFIDNYSTDNTRPLLENLCSMYPQVRAIFNAKNFQSASGFYGVTQTTGDCTIYIPCDYQVPLSLIPEMIEKWEEGAKVVCLVKTMSKENKFMLSIRRAYYALSNKFSETEIIRGFTASGLYDKSFLDLFRSINDPVSPLGTMILSFGSNVVRLPYIEQKRKAGKSKQTFWSLLNSGINRFTNASSSAPRFAIVIGFFISIICFIVGLIYLILKLMFWDLFLAGVAPAMIGIFFIGAVQMFFIGLIGDYVVKANVRLARYPQVIEEKRLNFPENL